MTAAATPTTSRGTCARFPCGAMAVARCGVCGRLLCPACYGRPVTEAYCGDCPTVSYTCARRGCTYSEDHRLVDVRAAHWALRRCRFDGAPLVVRRAP